MDSQFVHEVLPVLLNRFDAYIQLASDLLVGGAFGDELKNLDLSVCEFHCRLMSISGWNLIVDRPHSS